MASVTSIMHHYHVRHGSVSKPKMSVIADVLHNRLCNASIIRYFAVLPWQVRTGSVEITRQCSAQKHEIRLGIELTEPAMLRSRHNAVSTVTRLRLNNQSLILVKGSLIFSSPSRTDRLNGLSASSPKSNRLYPRHGSCPLIHQCQS